MALLLNPSDFPSFHLVFKERIKQLTKGYDSVHDSEHTDKSLLDAAFVYILLARGDEVYPDAWPWDDTGPHADLSYEEQLVKAAALILAELDRVLSHSEQS